MVLAAVLPGALLLTLLAWRGRPVRLLAFCLFMGALACAPALLLERLLTLQPWNMGSFGIFLVFAIVVAGLVEEGCKLLAWYLGPARWTDVHTDEYDAILYSACVALGFATTENIAYCLAGGLSTALVRAFTAVPAHALFGVIMGSWLGMARVRARVGWDTGHLVLRGLLLAVLAHGIYDALAFHATVVSTWLLGIGLLGGVAWAVPTVVAARRRSPAYGGTAPAVPLPLGGTRRPAPPPPGRDPVHALLLGVVPGLGQLYNGQPKKAALFFGLAVFNGALYAVARVFADDPRRALEGMDWLGLTLGGLRAADVTAAVQQSPWLPLVFLSALLVGVVLGALDAWWEARPGLVARESFASHGAVLSYVTHVVLALLLAFSPVLARKMEEKVRQEQARSGQAKGQARSSPQEMVVQLTVVEKLDGWNPPGRTARAAAPKAEKPRAAAAPKPVVAPRPQPSPRKQVVVKALPLPAAPRPASSPTQPRRPAAAPSRPRIVDVPAPTVANGPSVRTRGRGADEARAPQGRGGDGVAVGTPGDGDAPLGQDGWFSYNQYLSYRFHEGREADYFFRFVPPDVWVVVRYEIDEDGTLLGAEVLETSGRPEQAARVCQMLHNCSPYRRLPPGVRRITVTELFWAREFTDFPSNSLAQSLSHLPDGRLIRE